MFRTSGDLFRHEVLLYLEEDGQPVRYQFRTVLPMWFRPGKIYALALVDGRHSVWHVACDVQEGLAVPGTVELLYPVEWGLYQ